MKGHDDEEGQTEDTKRHGREEGGEGTWDFESGTDGGVVIPKLLECPTLSRLP
jgi:hypothetical protein